MTFEGFELIKLAHDTAMLPFDCGNEELNGFFVDDAKRYLQELLAQVYLLHNHEVTVAYWTYSNDKISYTDINNEDKWYQRIAIRGKDLKHYPAVKIGRLGVHKDFKGMGIGRLIIDYTKALFVDNNRTGCKYITVDAFRESLEFYERNGFSYLSGKDRRSDTRLMYYNLGRLF